MENLNNKIHDYLDGTLTAAETQAFETALTTDKDLSNEVKLYNDLIKGIEIGADDSLRQSINTVKQRLIDENFFSHLDVVENTVEVAKPKAIIRTLPNAATTQNTTKIRRLSIYKWAVAASVLVVIAVALWLFQPNKKALFSETYTAYFQPESKKLADIHSELNTVGFAADKARNASLETALKAYENKNFTVAKALFQTHLAAYAQDSDAEFYTAMTLMSLKDAQNAAIYLENLLKNSKWEKDAQWYLALNYLTIEGKHDAGLNLLKDISKDSASPYQVKAGEIWVKLK